MKKSFLKTGILAVTALLAMSFATVGVKTTPLKVKESKIEWIGKKVTGQHNGTIQLKSGEVLLSGKKVVGGTFVVDMPTIKVLDLEGEWKDKLEGHLKSDDFFGVDKFKEAKFVIKKVQGNKVTGDLTIKGKTIAHTFNLKVTGNSISGTINVDRTKYDIRYGSKSFFNDLQDKAIDDEFQLKLDFKF